MEEDCVDRLEKDYRQALADVEAIALFLPFFTHPLVPREKKEEFVERAFPAISDYLRNLFFLLVRNRREGYLRMIHEEFLTLRAEKEDLLRVKFATAKRLTREERERLAGRLSQVLGRKIAVEERLDATLLGGVRIEVEGKVLDGTLYGRLRKLQALLGE
jgi:F-type H+-transporting ATPase subunit delta